MKTLVSKSLSHILILFVSCSTHEAGNGPQRSLRVSCTPGEEIKIFKVGDLICSRKVIQVGPHEQLRVHFKVLNNNAEDLYEYGYQELLRYKGDKIVERIKLRREDDAYWSETPFVRVRKQKFLSDLDGDGYKEFAIFPFSPGSAIWGTVRIFSLKDKIEFWGEGRYQFENDTFVQLNCMDCSKFNSDACKKCR
jgi:hypothetical protein